MGGRNDGRSARIISQSISQSINQSTGNLISTEAADRSQMLVLYWEGRIPGGRGKGERRNVGGGLRKEWGMVWYGDG